MANKHAWDLVERYGTPGHAFYKCGKCRGSKFTGDGWYTYYIDNKKIIGVHYQEPECARWTQLELPL